jgi:DNA-binding response OmpR family regulator
MSGQLVYVVDDEPSIALTIAAVLRISGFSAEAFTKPLEALKAARMLAPDLLISDVMMPELLGFDLAIQSKEICPDCKTLLISGHPDAEHLLIQECGLGHNFQILPKPVHPLELLAEVRRQGVVTVSMEASIDPT